MILNGERCPFVENANRELANGCSRDEPTD
jgi:hypothetical protein